MKPFPLVPWLERRGIKPYTFAKMAGLSKRTVYAYCYGDRYPTTRPLMAIEAATDGEVTMREMCNWIEAARAEGEHGRDADASATLPAVAE